MDFAIEQRANLFELQGLSIRLGKKLGSMLMVPSEFAKTFSCRAGSQLQE